MLVYQRVHDILKWKNAKMQAAKPKSIEIGLNDLPRISKVNPALAPENGAILGNFLIQ